MIFIGFIIGTIISIWLMNKGIKYQQKDQQQLRKHIPFPQEWTEQKVLGNTIADEAIRRADIYADFIQHNLAEQGLNPAQISEILNRLESIVSSR